MQRDRYPSFVLFLWPTLAIGLVLLVHERLDLIVSDFFWDRYPGFQAGPICKFIYHWGVWPGIISGLVALALLIMQISPKWQKYRTGALMAFLALILGPGLIINHSLKGYLERPRPIQLERYAGKYEYVPLQKLQFKPKDNTQKSFPSGHASMGFYFLCLWRIASREGKKAWARRALAAAIALTFALGWTRMAQGGHFISDVLLSGYIVWLVTLALESWCYGKRERIPLEVIDSDGADHT